jgi:hypothetical protein
MPRRLVLILIALGLTLAVTAAPVAAGGGSLSIGAADGLVVGGFLSTDGTTWASQPGTCFTGTWFPPQAEGRFALEVPLAGLPAGATITGATLRLQVNPPPFGLEQQAMYGYAGDGVIQATDVQVSGTPMFFTPDVFPHEFDVTTVLAPAMVSAGWAGFSIREDPLQPLAQGGASWRCGESVLTITYDLPNPTPVASLPNAAMDTSADTSPLLALGFAALLFGSLGTLAFVNSRRR